MRDPVLCNSRAIAQPYGIVPLNMLQQAQQCSNPARASNDPSMQADRHHARTTVASDAVQPVEGIPAVSEEVFARAEVAAALQAAVIGVKAMRDDEMRSAGDACPVGEVVV